MEIKNTKELKKHNKYIVLNEIIKKQPVSRKELSSELDVSHATISYICKDLIESNLIEETKSLKSTGGRPPKVLEFKGANKFTVVVELSYQQINFSIYNLDLKLIVKESIKTNNLKTEEIIKVIANKINSILFNLDIRKSNLIGIIIAVPGVYNQKTDKLTDTNIELWNNLSLKNEFKKYFDLPIYIENDANIFAYYESKSGVASSHQNILYIYIAGGIGSALIIEGELYRGSHGRAGEISHIKVSANGEKCYCGELGCLESKASINALNKKIAKIYNQENPQIDLDMEKIIDKYKKGDPQIVEIVKESTEYFSTALNSLLDFIDPDLIIIGDLYNIYNDKILKKIKNKINTKDGLEYQLVSRSDEDNIEAKAAAKYILDNWKLNL